MPIGVCMNGMMSPPCERIVSVLNVEEEAFRAFYISLTKSQSVDDYIIERHLHFCSRQVEGSFLNHLLALTELALDACAAASQRS